MNYVVPESMFKTPEPTLEDYRVLANRFGMALEAILECNVNDGQTMQHIAQVALEGRNGS